MGEVDPPFQSIAIVGVGLIGGSIALAAREQWPSARILGVDRPAILAHALGSGAIERGVESPAAIGETDLVILAAPVRQNAAILREISQQLPAHTVVTDVGGTKRDIAATARALSLAATFVGGHPIGGAERGGFGFARPDLFKGRPWIFVPDDRSPADAVERLFRFARGLGGRPLVMDAESHDRAMAFVSHLPQLAVSALMDAIGDAGGAEALRLAGRGLLDTTRLASSPPDTWRDICATNTDEIGRALDALIARLTDLRRDLDNGPTIDRIFDGATRWRAELMKGRE